MKINVLPQSIANMIAAGEVVERPASVVKELVENSVDAGAKNITVEIQKGGMTYIRISDDGSGISPEDAPTAFLRHATSKIKAEEDLNSIYTLGFRGEALASIAAVAKVDMFTKTRDNTFGRCISIEGGEIIENEEAGCGDGTTIIVRDLFFNTPARMKFLKNDSTETGYVTDTVNKLILSHPEVKIKLIVNGRQTVSSAGDGRLISAIYAVYGKDYQKNMTEVSYAEDGIEVTGYVGNSSLSRKDRRHQVFFINGRYISSKIMASALSEAFQNTVMVGRHPVAVLMVKVMGSFVDVNVHPTKMEVRFSDDKKVYSSVFWAVKNALSAKKYVPEASVTSHGESAKDELKIRAEAAKVKNEATQLDINFLRDSFFSPKPEEKKVEPQHKTDALSKEPPKDLGDNSSKTLEVSFDDAEEKEISGRIKSNTFFTDSSPITLKAPAPKRGYEKEEDAEGETTKKDTLLNPESKDINRSPESEPDSYDDLSVTDDKLKPEDVPSAKEAEDKVPDIALNQDIHSTKEVPVTSKPTLKCGVDFKLIGQVFATYIIVQKENEMIIIDQHAAHERLYFEELVEDFRKKTMNSQRLLLPVTVNFEPSRFPLVCENLSFFEELGFECEEFGECTIVVRAYPASLGDADIADTLISVAGLIDSNCVDIKKTLAEEILHTMACKRAIKGNRILEKEEMEALAEKVLSFDSINTCPHGRPICVSMTKYEMEKQFKRIV